MTHGTDEYPIFTNEGERERESTYLWKSDEELDDVGDEPRDVTD